MTPYKSMSKGTWDRIGPQECPTHGHSHPLHGAVCYDHGHLFAPFGHAPVSRDARHLEKPSSPHPVLAGVHASPVPRAENLGRTRPLDASPGHHNNTTTTQKKHKQQPQTPPTTHPPPTPP